MTLPPPFERLCLQFAKLPGIGKRTAERLAFALLDWTDEERAQFAKTIQSTPDELCRCKSCYCLIEKERASCPFCDPSLRDAQTLCIVASWREVFSIEATQTYRGFYHVLNGTLSPLEGREADSLTIEELMERLRQLAIKEVIIALDSTLEGDATSLYLSEKLQRFPVRVTRLAFGLPMGSSLDYVDESTLSQAFAGRGALVPPR